MAFRVWLVPAAGWILLTVASPGAQDSSPVIVQPGAPGKNSKILTPATATPPSRTPSEADISFMQGMIMHHSQAVEMTDLVRTRTKSPALQALGKRISISQTDEMKFMKQWLEDRGQSTETPGMSHMTMAGMDMNGMDHSKMNMDSMLMPGMLTRQQMQALAKASGPKFDRLFLTGMIQHHGGALTMVQDLFNTPGAGQDSYLFDFATDVDNTQRAEIDIMKNLLKEKK